MGLDKHNASGSSAGYIYQFERALLWLSTQPSGSRVGIETESDVVIEGVEQTTIHEQDKHSIRQDAVPFADRSKDLWNTLVIWLDAVENKEVDVQTTQFVMATNKTIPECIAKHIGRAESSTDIDACIDELRKAAKDPPEGVSLAMKRVMQPTSIAFLRQLIERCRLHDNCRGESDEQSKEVFLNNLQLPSWCAPHRELVFDSLFGWAIEVSISSWRNGRPAWIPRDSFVNQMHAILESMKRNIRRERSENLIPVNDEIIGKEKGSPFVRQIHLVTDDNILSDIAIREYVRCNIEKLRLSEEGEISDNDWIEFETTLHTRWEKIRGREIRMQKIDSDEDVGFRILSATTEDYKERLAGSETSQVYLTSGTYHRLANMLKVGWHPHYIERMKNLHPVKPND